jgi:hypothetical protein
MRKLQEGQAKQEQGALSKRVTREILRTEQYVQGPQTGQGLRKCFSPLKTLRGSRGPGISKEALTNIKIAILKETFAADTLTGDEQDLILE